MAKIVAWLVVGRMVCLIFGLGSCEPRIPVTVSADSVATETPDPESDDPAAAGRLKDCAMGGTCRVIHCAPGYCDDDGDRENGCEIAEKTCHPVPAAKN